MSESDQSFNKDDVNKLFFDSMSKGVDSLGSHSYKDGEQTKKIFGWEVDSAIANMIEVGYNSLIGGFTNYVGPHAYDAVQRFGKSYGKNHLSIESLNRTAAGVSFAVNAAIYAFPSISEAYGLWNKQRDVNFEIVRQLSPVLDEIKGKHGVAAYNSVSIDQNEMIANYRWRMAKVNHANLTHFILPTLVKILPNIWFHERDKLGAFQSGKKLSEVQNARLFHEVAHTQPEKVAELHNKGLAEEAKITAEDVTAAHVADLYESDDSRNSINKHMESAKQRAALTPKGPQEGFHMGGFGSNLVSNSMLTVMANKMVESSARRLKQSFPTDYTALDMVINLQQQLGSEPTPSSFQLPNKGRSLPLEAYIADIMMQHQRDMSNMNPDYAVIRDALRENVLAAAKPLAAALRKGDIGALALVNYIGSGKIIRNKGRLIASADEVEAMIEHDAGKHVVSVAIDPKDFWSDASYTAKEGKEAFLALQGEERQLAIALVPHGIRKEFGVSDKESKEVDAAMVKNMDRSIAEAILGINELDDNALCLEGLAKVEIAQFREAAQQIKRQGEAAVHDLKSSATHTNGIERILLGVTVGCAIKGEREHLGTLLQQGREKFSELEAAAQKHEATHSGREEKRRTKAEQTAKQHD